MTIIVDLDNFAERIDALCKDLGINYEEFLQLQSDVAQRDAESQTHPEVKACLEGMADMLDAAAFNFYASFK